MMQVTPAHAFARMRSRDCIAALALAGAHHKRAACRDLAT
jgi:hypothetical protein